MGVNLGASKLLAHRMYDSHQIGYLNDNEKSCVDTLTGSRHQENWPFLSFLQWGYIWNKSFALGIVGYARAGLQKLVVSAISTTKAASNARVEHWCHVRNVAEENMHPIKGNIPRMHIHMQTINTADEDSLPLDNNYESVSPTAMPLWTMIELTEYLNTSLFVFCIFISDNTPGNDVRLYKTLKQDDQNTSLHDCRTMMCRTISNWA